MPKPLFFVSTIAVLFYGLVASGRTQSVVWDTVGTGTVRLAVSNHGSMGLNGVGGANMDFTWSGVDCDPNADVYLNSGGLFIIQKIDSAAGIFMMSTGLYQDDASASFAFKPDGAGPASSHFVGPDGSDAFFTGRFLNWDSTIGIEQTYYAPTKGRLIDNFIIVRTDIYSIDGLDHPHLAIGEVIDWKIPSDSYAANRSGIYREIVYLQGVDKPPQTGCQFSDERFGTSVFLGSHTSTEVSFDSCATRTAQRGIYAIDNLAETVSAPNGVLDSSLVWNSTGSLIGQWVLVDSAADQRIYSTFVHGYTLTALDTLTVYTAILSQREGYGDILDASRKYAEFWYNEHLRCGGLDPNLCSARLDFNGDGIVDFGDQYFFIEALYLDFGYHVDTPTFDVNLDCVIDWKDLDTWLFCAWYNPPGMCNYPRVTCCNPEVDLTIPCCVDVTGNVDDDSNDITDIADLTFLIDHLFINFPAIRCPDEANIDGDTLGIVDIGDLTVLIDHLFINFPTTALCQE